MSPAVLALEAVGALALFAGVASLGRRRQTVSDEMSDRLHNYGAAGGGEPALFANPSQRARRPAGIRATVGRVVEAFNTRLGGSNEAKLVKLSEDLARADLKLRPGEWYLINIGLILFGVLLGFAVYRSPVFAGIFAIVGWAGPSFFLRFRQRRRARKFNDQLGDVLALLSNALKAGYSFPQAMATIGKGAEPPIADEFVRATREVQLGVSTDEALVHTVNRVDSEDFDLMVTAVQIQRIVGGNLAEILDTIAFTIRERIRIKGEINTLTAQARASGYIIAALPIFLALVLSAISPAYFDPMLKFPGPGPIILGIGLVMIAIGFGIIKRIIKIEV